MTSLPRISGRECIAALGKAGLRVVRRERSPIVVRRDQPFAQLVVPDHRRLDRGTLRSIIRPAELAVGAFVALL